MSFESEIEICLWLRLCPPAWRRLMQFIEKLIAGVVARSPRRRAILHFLYSHREIPPPRRTRHRNDTVSRLFQEAFSLAGPLKKPTFSNPAAICAVERLLRGAWLGWSYKLQATIVNLQLTQSCLHESAQVFAGFQRRLIAFGRFLPD